MSCARILPALLACLVVVGCARREESDIEVEPDAATSETTEDASGAPAQASPAEPDGDRIGQSPAPKVVAGVNIRVTLSPAAASELAGRSETVVVEAIYGGDPAPGSSAPTNDFGLVELGSETRELKSAGEVVFDADSIDASRLDMIAGQPQVMVNVRSGRKSSQGNLLACDFYWNSVEAASAATVEIPCKLLSE